MSPVDSVAPSTGSSTATETPTATLTPASSAPNAFAQRLERGQSPSNNARPASKEDISGSDVIAFALRDAEVQAETNQDLGARAFAFDAELAQGQSDKSSAALYQKNPFGPPDPFTAQEIAAVLTEADPHSLNMRLLRLQYRMQLESERFMFESNSLKSDNEDAKNVLNNLR
jgi:hypothetical protein